MHKVIERNTSLDIAEQKIDTYFSNKNITVKIGRYGTPLSSTVVTLTFPDTNEESCIGCGKGYEREARVGAKYEAYEHHQGLVSLRQNSMLVPFSSVVSQPEISALFPLQVLARSQPTKISAIPFYHPVDETGDDLLYPSFLIDYKYPMQKMSGDDADYRAAKRYSCGTGLAAGFDYTEAAIHAISEVIERHCYGRFLARIFFHELDSSVRQIEPETMPADLQEILRDAEGCLGEEILLIDISHDNLPAVFVAYCQGRTISGVHVMGAGCSIYPGHAATRAIKELVQQYSVAEGVDTVKNEWLKHINHLQKYPRLLKCLIADLSDMELSCEKMPADPDVISLDEHLALLIENCRKSDLPVWVREIHRDETGVSIACAVMPGMERFSIVSLGNYVIPTNRYE